MPALPPGSPAPDFDLPTDGGGRISLADLRGRKVVLYFYPKDNTAGCTLEAIDFSAQAAAFEAAGATVIGVSADSVKSTLMNSGSKQHWRLRLVRNRMLQWNLAPSVPAW